MIFASTILVFGSMSFVVVCAAALARDMPTHRRESLLAAGLAAPPVVLFVPFAASADAGSFAISRSANYVCYVLILGVALAFAALCLRLFRSVAPDRADGSLLDPGALAGALVALSSLHALGRLLQGRLVVVKNPADGFGPIFERLAAQSSQMVIPVVGLALVVVCVEHRDRFSGVIRWIDDAQSGKRIVALSAVAVLALFGLPLIGGATADAYLTFAGVRTPELGVYLLFGGLAVLAARQRRSPPRFGWWRPRELLHHRRALGAIVLLALATGLSAVRNDLGSLVAVVAGYTGSRIALYRNLDDDALRGGGLATSVGSHPVVRYSRQWVAALVVAVALVVGLAVALDKQSRFETWLDPWQYPFVSGSTCQPPEDVGLSTAELAPAEPVPTGVEACVVEAGSGDLSRRSQVAKGLLAVEGGGLWGRGLADTHTGQLQLPLRESDFVIATVWSKVGGAATLLLMLQLIALGVSIARVPGRRRARWSTKTAVERAAVLYSAAIGSAVIWTGIFVIATNVAVLPHSGIPFPLVAEGSQAAAALVGALGALVILCAAVTDLPRAPRTQRPRRRPGDDVVSVPPRSPARSLTATVKLLGRSQPAAVVAGVLSVALVLWGLAFPMNAWLPRDSHVIDLDSGWEHADARLRAAGARPDRLTIPSLGTFEWTGSRWTAVVGDASVDPVWEFVTRYGNGEGFVDDLLEADQGAAPRSFWDRLRLPGTTSGRQLGLSLTVDLDLQERVRSLLREAGPSGTRVAAGVAVVDATSGAVLALGSAPTPLDVSVPTEVREAVARLNESEGERSNDQGYRSRTTGEDDCSGSDCIAIDWQVDPDLAWLPGDPLLSTYLGLPDEPSSLGNRSWLKDFGPGSIFKVVVAAAYLLDGGGIEDQLESPPFVIGGDGQIDNVYDGECPGTVDGRLSLADALAVSCNTTFVLLARSLGWDPIKDAARRLGLFVEGHPEPSCSAPWSFVPATAESGLDDLALGGGDLRLTPLAAATMMATIANDGFLVQPFGLTGNGVEEACRTQSIQPEVAAQLRAAMTEAITRGTLLGIADDVAWAGKSGTHVLQGPPGPIDRNVWVAGIVESDDGPVAFAVATESIGTEAGRERARTVAAGILEEVSHG